MNLTTEQTQGQITELQESLSVLTEFNNLKDESYFLKKLLIMLERIAIAQERTIKELEKNK
jgi:hypothetical protein